MSGAIAGRATSRTTGQAETRMTHNAWRSLVRGIERMFL
jgi:hypothetical protein